MIKVTRIHGGFQSFPTREHFLMEIKDRMEEIGSAIMIVQEDHEMIIYKAGHHDYLAFKGEEFVSCNKNLHSFFPYDKKECFAKLNITSVTVRVKILIFEGETKC